jgi:hypothetical protein
MSCNTPSLHINGIPVENQESRSVKLKNLYDIFYSEGFYPTRVLKIISEIESS